MNIPKQRPATPLPARKPSPEAVEIAARIMAIELARKPTAKKAQDSRR